VTVPWSPALALVPVLVLLRTIELVLSRRNELRLFRRKGFEVDRAFTRLIMVFHAAYLLTFAVEAWLRQPDPWLPLPLAAAVLVTLEAARLWCIASLGDRWSVRVIALPGESLRTRGPYRWLRHPNYLAVSLQMVLFPLVLGCPFTALVGGTANLLVVTRRIRAENAVLDAAP